MGQGAGRRNSSAGPLARTISHRQRPAGLLSLAAAVHAFPCPRRLRPSSLGLGCAASTCVSRLGDLA